MIPIAVDAMGGDFAPGNLVEGVGKALDTLPDLGPLFLVGDKEKVSRELRRIGKFDDDRIQLIHSDQVVEMTESPAAAIRNKPGSSIAMAVDLVKQGRARAVFSAGHTGAAVASSVLKLRPLPGIEKPAIATIFPSATGRFLVLDAGASVDCRSRHLAQFAVMGEIYCQYVLGIESPRIALLNIGEETTKGNGLTKETYQLLEKMRSRGLNFVGNVQGTSMFDGNCDVVLCDGFVGNVVLKCSEGSSQFFSGYLKKYIQQNWLRRFGAFLARNAFKDLKAIADHSEYGGAPLLGVNGICIIGHGSSCPNAVANALKVARRAVEEEIGEHLLARIDHMRINSADKKRQTADREKESCEDSA